MLRRVDGTKTGGAPREGSRRYFENAVGFLPYIACRLDAIHPIANPAVQTAPTMSSGNPQDAPATSSRIPMMSRIGARMRPVTQTAVQNFRTCWACEVRSVMTQQFPSDER